MLFSMNELIEIGMYNINFIQRLLYKIADFSLDLYK